MLLLHHLRWSSKIQRRSRSDRLRCRYVTTATFKVEVGNSNNSGLRSQDDGTAVPFKVERKKNWNKKLDR